MMPFSSISILQLISILTDTTHLTKDRKVLGYQSFTTSLATSTTPSLQ